MKQMMQTASVVVALMCLLGCATSNPGGRVLASTVAVVDVAMQGWAAYVAGGHATADQENTVRAAYGRYQLAETAAETAYLAWVKTGEDDAWLRASNAMRASQVALCALIDSFTVAQ